MSTYLISMHRPIRFLLAILLALLSISGEAKGNDSSEAVTLVSYEQSWIDRSGTLALRNNTNTTIKSISFRMLYLDMQGNQLDYNDFTRAVDIAPGMVRKVDIPAYEHDRWYSYYKSEASSSSPHRFKVKFQLQSYNDSNSKGQQYQGANDFDAQYEDLIRLRTIFIFAMPFLGIIYVALLIGVGRMAQKRQRSTPLWIMVSLFATPLVAMLLLYCLGDSDNYRDYGDYE